MIQSNSSKCWCIESSKWYWLFREVYNFNFLLPSNYRLDFTHWKLCRELQTSGSPDKRMLIVFVVSNRFLKVHNFWRLVSVLIHLEPQTQFLAQLHARCRPSRSPLEAFKTWHCFRFKRYWLWCLHLWQTTLMKNGSISFLLQKIHTTQNQRSSKNFEFSRYSNWILNITKCLITSRKLFEESFQNLEHSVVEWFWFWCLHQKSASPKPPISASSFGSSRLLLFFRLSYTFDCFHQELNCTF